MTNTSFAAALFPQHAGRSGVDAVIGAAEDATAQFQRVVDENAELRCRVQELEAENSELKDRVEEFEWNHQGCTPKAATHG